MKVGWSGSLMIHVDGKMWLLHITNHPQQKLYKTNHLFFHFTKLTTLIHNHPGANTTQNIFAGGPSQGRTTKNFPYMFAPPTGEHSREIFCSFAQKFFTFQFVYLIYKKFKKRENCDNLYYYIL